MIKNITNQFNQPHISQDSNQPSNASPISQPYMIYQFYQPYSNQQFPQPYINKPITQQNIVAGPDFQDNSQLYTFQPGVTVVTNSKYLKKKLFCPKFWTWFMFVYSLVDIFIYLIFNKLPIVGVISCIPFFIVAFLISQSGETNDIKKFNQGLCLYIICFVVGCFVFIYFIILKKIFSPKFKKILPPLYIFEVIFGSITLFVLKKFKKEYNTMSFENQQLVTAQQI